MRLLVDANLSPLVAASLGDGGHDAVHVFDIGLATALDPEIVDYAEADSRVVVTIDTDFPMLLALRRSSSPSILLLRAVNELSPAEHAALVLTNLPAVADELRQGAIVSLGPDRLRVRNLPLG